jgi:hypothetical protein
LRATLTDVDPRARVLYLAIVAVLAFFVKDARFAVGLAAAHAGLWLVLRLGARALLRQIVKLWGFTAFVLFSYAITSEDPSVDRWVAVWRVHVNVGGMAIGALMIARVLTVILASRIARAGDERAIATGLGRLGAPDIVASSIDAVLALLGGRGGGGGGGGGGGRGRGRHRGDEEPRGFFASLRAIAKGDVAPIVDRIERHIGRADAYLDAQGKAPDARRHDVTVIVGLSLTMLGIKALKLLPNIPFAPGHKLVLLTPLYVVAAIKTKTRLGATLTGLVMGTVAFLLGDGRYGIFEIVKHIAPGLVCDLVVPLVVRARPRAAVWSLVGGAMGIARFATIFTVTLTVQAPAVAFAFLVPGLVIHTTFGVLSGFVSAPLIRAVLDRRRPEPATQLETQRT